MFYVYILQSLKDKRFYIGSTENIEMRIDEHNSGQTKSLRNRRPLKLIYQDEFFNRSDAIRREAQIKSYKGGNALKNLLMGP